MGNGSSPCQYIDSFDTARKAIDCATTLPLTVFIYNETLQQTFRPAAAERRESTAVLLSMPLPVLSSLCSALPTTLAVNVVCLSWNPAKLSHGWARTA